MDIDPDRLRAALGALGGAAIYGLVQFGAVALSGHQPTREQYRALVLNVGWRMPARIRLFPAPKVRKTVPAGRRWLETFVDQCDADGLAHLAALVLFMNLTGARVSEAIALLGEHVDLRQRTALLVKTKTDVNSLRYLPDHLVERIRDLDPRAGQRVFRYRCRFSVNERIKAVCARAGLLYKSSHTVGRHAFATNALNAGVSVRVAMDAGRTVRDRFNAIHHQDQF